MKWIQKINTKKELVALAEKLGVRDDWHEPDEQGIDVVVRGNSFGNAGFWPAGEFGTDSILEKHVIIKKDGKPVGVINLATLFAIACGFTSVSKESNLDLDNFIQYIDK